MLVVHEPAMLRLHLLMNRLECLFASFVIRLHAVLEDGGHSDVGVLGRVDLHVQLPILALGVRTRQRRELTLLLVQGQRLQRPEVVGVRLLLPHLALVEASVLQVLTNFMVIPLGLLQTVFEPEALLSAVVDSGVSAWRSQEWLSPVQFVTTSSIVAVGTTCAKPSRRLLTERRILLVQAGSRLLEILLIFKHPTRTCSLTHLALLHVVVGETGGALDHRILIT